MRAATPTSPWRRLARVTIHQVIEDHVLGPVQCLHREDVLELRKVLRIAYRETFAPFGNYPYRVWCEEVTSALGYPPPRRVRHKKPVLYKVHKVMPSMRVWAAARGILAEETSSVI